MTRQKTTNYFSHDSNARNDEKLIRLRMKHSAAGYGVYFMLLERLREETDYMSAKDYNMIAFDLRVDASLVKSVVEDFGLFAFTDDGKCFYSESFLNRMSAKDAISKKRCEAGKAAMAKRWSLNEDVITNVTESDNNAITNVTESDNKKSKENKINIKEEPPKGGKKKDALSSSTHTPLEILEKKRKKFYDELLPFVGKYGKEMIREFYDYWSEANKSKTGIRKDLEKTFEIPRRLATWERNEYRFRKGTIGKQTTKTSAADIQQREKDNENLMKRLDDMQKHAVSREDAMNSEEYKRALRES